MSEAITKAAQDALAELADWHWSQATTLRKAASTTAMDKPEPCQSSLTRMADWHDAQKSLIRAALQDHPVPAPSPQAPGRRKGPPGITLEPQGHEPPAVLVDELPDLNPEDFVVDVVLKQLGGFAPITTHGVRVTHKPSRVSVVVDSERSQYRNRQLALEALRAIIRRNPGIKGG